MHQIIRQMLSHLNHKIPWDKLDEIVIIKENDGFVAISITDEKAERYFASSLMDAIMEFAKTNRVEKQEREEFDLSRWDGGVFHDAGGHLGVVDSVISAYIVINMLLCNWAKFRPVIDPKGWLIYVCRGEYDGAHPDAMAERCRKFMTPDQKDFKEFNVETLQSMKEYVKVLFKCLYYHVVDGNRGDISTECIVGNINWSLERRIMRQT